MSDKITHLNRCDLVRGHFSWAPSERQFPATSGDTSIESSAGTEGKLTDLALSYYGQRLLSSRESRMAGPAHWKSFLQGHGTVHFFAGVGPRASARQNPREPQPESIPSHGRSEVTGRDFPAFGRIPLNGSRPTL